MLNLNQIDETLKAAKAYWERPGTPLAPGVHALLYVAEAMRAYIASIHGDDLDDPMPVFVLKAKDKLTSRALVGYIEACDDVGLGEQTRQVLRAADEFTAWQERNPDRVKLPDHKHVPVGDAVQYVE